MGSNIIYTKELGNFEPLYHELSCSIFSSSTILHSRLMDCLSSFKCEGGGLEVSGPNVCKNLEAKPYSSVLFDR